MAWNRNGPAMEFDYCCPIAVLSVIGNVSVLCMKLVIVKLFAIFPDTEWFWFLEHRACIVLFLWQHHYKYSFTIAGMYLQVHFCAFLVAS